MANQRKLGRTADQRKALFFKLIPVFARVAGIQKQRFTFVFRRKKCGIILIMENERIHDLVHVFAVFGIHRDKCADLGGFQFVKMRRHVSGQYRSATLPAKAGTETHARAFAK